MGNLVCPSSYDVGEDLRLVLLSVTEGEDKPLKYPTIFNTADLAVLTKMDLADAVEFDLVAAESNIQRVRPGMPLLKVSLKDRSRACPSGCYTRLRRASALPRSIPPRLRRCALAASQPTQVDNHCD